ncbi:SycD/LcrH family type III secretion system chaperone [Lampropedia aestuarii]|uniref:SycD/LcrH family type III secretion system chaperone n=1 Tax=Lampropedia aestuarii TaxID=2562762 RepID=UPI0024685165|nr:SycD/LcrH family type III secretion system chaperone [Lampropedia aestuarii]MDH5857328.1 SycD/LcrH family type III secretion system chaperone [Lampropedia aestuarii]
MTEVLQDTTNSQDQALQQLALVRQTLVSGGTIGGLRGISQQECEALYQFGHGFYVQARYSEAFQVFALLVTYDHLEPRYLMALAGAAQMLHRYEDALQHYGTAALLLIDDAAPYIHAAECALSLGRRDAAEEGLKLALDVLAMQTNPALQARAETLLEMIVRPGEKQ